MLVPMWADVILQKNGSYGTRGVCPGEQDERLCAEPEPAACVGVNGRVKKIVNFMSSLPRGGIAQG